QRGSALDAVPTGMPALARAQKLGSRAARHGFDWKDASGVLEKLREEMAEVEQARHGQGDLDEEIGDLLFTVVNLCRHEGIDAEGALRHANAKFERRFRAVETRLSGEDRSMASTEAGQLEQLWDDVKRAESSS
ncbi:MAG: nucleoside triphosphate pyrophosphohydrolase, partial [Chromatiales bacterium]|nr:nucleoside triphosphate pyrophosphohydrolase [Chromatiales bacterium]